jgi:hypothetical protein
MWGYRAAPQGDQSRQKSLNLVGASSVYMLDVLVAEIGLQGTRIMPLVGQREAAGMPQHVGVCLEAEAKAGRTFNDAPTQKELGIEKKRAARG